MTTRHILLTLFAAAILSPGAEATITVRDYWRMGENDPGAHAGSIPSTTTDSVGPNNLSCLGGPIYTSDTSSAAVAHVGSSLSLNWLGATYGTCPSLTNVTDNFGIEAWVKPTGGVTASQVIAYYGNPGSSGWGMRVINGGFQILLRGGIFTTTAGSAANNARPHVAP